MASPSQTWNLRASQAWENTHLPVWEATSSPYVVRTLFAQKKDVEEQSLREKARLRLDADSNKRRAQKLKLQHEQLQSLHKYQDTENKALKTALRKRDVELDDLRQKLSEVQASHGETLTKEQERVQAAQAEAEALQEQLQQVFRELHVKEDQSDENTNTLQQVNELKAALEEATDSLHHHSDHHQTLTSLLVEMIDAQLAQRRSSIEGLQRLLKSLPSGLDLSQQPAESYTEEQGTQSRPRDQRPKSAH